eukprot:comp97953_c0_seq1/m.48686 comp97953_c0_seq1/g.48686  ORF comp97953_c0_seq1/g.48686 comp97953_c0_seq1/m.48686 type:complete len:736 (-) comp97953_c0_seq1:150-2357(-)
MAASAGGKMPGFKMKELHYVPFPSPINMYGTAAVQVAGHTHMFAACRDREVLCVGMEGGALSVVEMHLVDLYDKTNAEVVALDALVRARDGAILIAVTIVKLETANKPEHFKLNIYGSRIGRTTCSTADLAAIAGDCQSFSLSFVPFQLLHTRCPLLQAPDVFLLCGSDHEVHMYSETVDQVFESRMVESIMPELHTTPSSVLALEIFYLGNLRVTALGCRNGYLQTTIIDTKTMQTVALQSVYMDGPITSLKIFTDFTRGPNLPSSLGIDLSAAQRPVGLGDLHLLVGCAVEECVVYRNIGEVGLEQGMVLAGSECRDSVLCVALADLDWDGCPEMLVGTYARTIVAYKRGDANGVVDGVKANPSYNAVWEQTYAHPVYGLVYGDVTGDGVCELLVATTKGMHVMQHDLEATEARVRESLAHIRRLLSLKTQLDKLQLQPEKAPAHQSECKENGGISPLNESIVPESESNTSNSADQTNENVLQELDMEGPGVCSVKPQSDISEILSDEISPEEPIVPNKVATPLPPPQTSITDQSVTQSHNQAPEGLQEDPDTESSESPANNLGEISCERDVSVAIQTTGREGEVGQVLVVSSEAGESVPGVNEPGDATSQSNQQDPDAQTISTQSKAALQPEDHSHDSVLSSTDSLQATEPKSELIASNFGTDVTSQIDHVGNQSNSPVEEGEAANETKAAVLLQDTSSNQSQGSATSGQSGEGPKPPSRKKKNKKKGKKSW